MAWPLIKLPFHISLASRRQTIVQISKVPFDLEVCTPKGVPREQPWWRTDRLDFYHLKSDGTIDHTIG